jgi:adenylyl- and sulfurtransferase ThiI
MSSFVVHYQEIALTGKNRPWFIGRLARNIRAALADYDVQVRILMGRIEVVIGPATPPAAVGDRLSRVFGVAN